MSAVARVARTAASERSAAGDATMPQALRAACASVEPCVLITVAAVAGSAPREAGAKMLVSPASVVGTIGGGHLEFQAIAIARDMLRSGEIAQLRRFALGATLGQCCGGAVQLLFEPVTPGADWLASVRECARAAEPCVIVTSAQGEEGTGKAVARVSEARGSLGTPALDRAAARIARAMLAERGGARLVRIDTSVGERPYLFDPILGCDWRIVLFGAGHVGQALVRALSELPCEIRWVDTREAIFPEKLAANVVAVATDCAEDEVDAAHGGTHFVVMTHSHALDQSLAERILRRGDFAYFGLIGSATKRKLFERRMAARGVPHDRFARMTCPIGVPGISGKEPAVVALAVAAQLLQAREKFGSVAGRARLGP